MAGAVPNNPLIIFLHLPKTAGTTLAKVLEREYGSTAIVDCYDLTTNAEFARYSGPAVERARVIEGHFHFGIHSAITRPSTYITVLRDPVDRVVSHYHFVRSQSEHYLHEEASEMTLAEFVASQEGAEPNNDQTRLLAGSDPADILSVAKQHLRDYFSVVGLTEEFDRSLILMKRAFGWKTPHYVPQNVGRHRASRDMLDAGTLRLINACNQLDRELYEFARSQFAKNIQRQGESFEREVQRFRRTNSLYARLHLPVASIVKQRRARL